MAAVPAPAPQPQYQPPPPQYQQVLYPQPVVVQQTTSGLAIASMVLGILWLYWVGSILAIVFGHIALRQINESGGRIGGRGMAIAGVALGWIGAAVLLIFLLFIASLN